MSDEIRLGGLGLKPGVIDRIVTLAAAQVEGVSVCGQTFAGRVQKGAAAKGVEVTVGEDGQVAVDIHVEVDYGRALPAVSQGVQEAVSDAVRSQVGVAVESVDVFIDGVAFPE